MLVAVVLLLLWATGPNTSGAKGLPAVCVAGTVVAGSPASLVAVAAPMLVA